MHSIYVCVCVDIIIKLISAMKVTTKQVKTAKVR